MRATLAGAGCRKLSCRSFAARRPSTAQGAGQARIRVSVSDIACDNAAVTEPQEHVLTGGNVSAGVVRVGDTVRKPAGPHTAAVEAFLSYLNAAGFSGAPRSTPSPALTRSTSPTLGSLFAPVICHCPRTTASWRSVKASRSMGRLH